MAELPLDQIAGIAAARHRCRRPETGLRGGRGEGRMLFISVRDVARQTHFLILPAPSYSARSCVGK